MLKILRTSAARCAAVTVVCVTSAVAAYAQNPPAPQTQAQPAPSDQQAAPTPPVVTANPAQPAAPPNPNDDLLAKAAKLYYSTTAAGLDGFDCSVHPEWRELLAGPGKGATIKATDPRLILLNAVRIKLHARLKVDSTVEWVPPSMVGKPLDDATLALLERMDTATEQTLQGFLQFWIPFIDGSTVPATSEGLQITKTAMGYTLFAEQNGNTLTEQFDPKLLLTRFDVAKNGATLDFAPAFASTAQGLLVSGFTAHIQPGGTPPPQAQQMNTTIEYQAVGGFPVPSKLTVEVLKTGAFRFTLDDCSVIPTPR